MFGKLEERIKQTVDREGASILVEIGQAVRTIERRVSAVGDVVVSRLVGHFERLERLAEQAEDRANERHQRAAAQLDTFGRMSTAEHAALLEKLQNDEERELLDMVSRELAVVDRKIDELLEHATRQRNEAKVVRKVLRPAATVTGLPGPARQKDTESLPERVLGSNGSAPMPRGSIPVVPRDEEHPAPKPEREPVERGDELVSVTMMMTMTGAKKSTIINALRHGRIKGAAMKSKRDGWKAPRAAVVAWHDTRRADPVGR